jgi:HSP20 family protein
MDIIRKLNPSSWFKHEEDRNRNLPARYAQTYNPLEALHQDIDRMFDKVFRSFGLPSLGLSGGFDTGQALLRPNVDVASTDKEYTITVEVPGVEEDDVRLELTADGVLTIRGEKKKESEQKEKNFYRVERSYGSFQRTLSLPEDVNQEAINAKFKNGVLTITLPRKTLPQSAVKRIEINKAA